MTFLVTAESAFRTVVQFLVWIDDLNCVRSPVFFTSKSKEIFLVLNCESFKFNIKSFFIAQSPIIFIPANIEVFS